MKEKKKNYRLRSKVYRGLGIATIGAGTLGGFTIYEVMTDWSNFNSQIQDFILIEENTIKLNLFFALPFLFSLLVFLAIMLKKNREFFKDKVSFNLLFAVVVCYLFYSVVEVMLSVLTGAFLGAIADEFVFSPLNRAAKTHFIEEKDINSEFKKEQMRIRARKNANSGEKLDGSV